VPFGTVLFAVSCSVITAGTVVEHPLLFRPSGHAVCVELFVDEGGAMNLRVISGGQPSFDLPHAWDTTSVTWIDDHRLMYATSTIYGDGGIYLFDFRTLAISEVIPEHPADPRLFSWARLVSADARVVTCWIADVNHLDEGHLDQTATKISFRWKTSPIRQRAGDEPAA
jgi:hypothetical protein